MEYYDSFDCEIQCEEFYDDVEYEDLYEDEDVEHENLYN